MRNIFSVLVGLATVSFAQTVDIPVISVTQAVAVIKGYSGSCTLTLREGSITGAIHPDANGVLDTARADLITWRDDSRLVTFGHDTTPLAQDTEYHLTVAGCMAQTATFRTRKVVLGDTAPRQLPWSASTWNNINYVALDLTDLTKKYTDPITGVRLRPLARAVGPTQISSVRNWGYWHGGTGWTNPANVMSVNSNPYATIAATTNPIYIYPQITDMTGRAVDITDLSIVVRGKLCTDIGVNCEINICLTNIPKGAGTCVGNTLTGIVTTNATYETIQEPSPGFPSVNFAGWGTTLTLDEMPVGHATVAAASGPNTSLTISSLSEGSRFPESLQAGSSVYVDGSDPTCPNNFCTVLSITSPAKVTITEALVAGNKTGATWPWAIKIWKTTAVGDVQIAAGYQYAGIAGVTNTSEIIVQHPSAITTADGKIGHVTFARWAPTRTYSQIYFISNDLDTIRFMSLVVIPHTQIATQYPVAADRINISQKKAQWPYGFDPSNGRVYYHLAGNGLGGTHLWKVELPDPTADFDFNWAQWPSRTDPPATCPAVPCDGAIWTNLTAGTGGINVNSDVLATMSAEEQTKFTNVWGAYSWTTVGLSGRTITFMKVPGQDAGIAWYAIYKINDDNTVQLARVFNTLAGTSDVPNMRWCNQHSSTIGTLNTAANVFILSCNTLPWSGDPASDLTRPIDGWQRLEITHIQRAGVWSDNTALPWPINNTYDNTCPSDITTEWKNYGAVGNQCVTMRVKGHPCGINPNAAELANYPCPWNVAYSQPPTTLKVGDVFRDQALVADPEDSEPLKVVKIECFNGNPDTTNCGGTNELTIVVQRNASWHYYCLDGTRGTAGVDKFPRCDNTAGRAIHADNWFGFMSPAWYHGGGDANLVIKFNHLSGQPTTIQSSELPRMIRGHGTEGVTSTGTMDRVGGNYAKLNAPLTGLGPYPVDSTNYTVLSEPKWEGVTRYTQQYLYRGNGDRNFIVDANAYNGSGNNQIGTRTIVATATSGVYKVPIIGGTATVANYKKFGMHGWSGRHMLKDVSKPTGDITTEVDWTMCIPMANGQCYAGSLVADNAAYVKVVNAEVLDTRAFTGEWWRNSPVVILASPVAGQARQFQIYPPHTAGNGSRPISYLFNAPGMTNFFWNVQQNDSGGIMIGGPGIPPNGINTIEFAVENKPWNQAVPALNKLGGAAVNIGPRANMTHARVQFGYNTELKCTFRNSICITDGALAPYAFADEALTPTVCNAATGCTITLPIAPGRLVYYKTEKICSGVVCNSGDIMVTERH